MVPGTGIWHTTKRQKQTQQLATNRVIIIIIILLLNNNLHRFLRREQRYDAPHPRRQTCTVIFVIAGDPKINPLSRQVDYSTRYASTADVVPFS